MKRRFSKILGVGLTLALLTSLLLTASPVLAAEVSDLDADTSPDEISLLGDYTLSFRINKTLDKSETITIRFPEDTDVSTVDEAGVLLSATSGIGSGAIVDLDPENQTGGAVDKDKDDRTVTITLPTADAGGSGYDPVKGIGPMAYIQIVIPDVTNPTETGVYRLEVKTTAESDYTESQEYDIDAPTVGGFVYVYNPSNVLMATFGGSAALNNAQEPIDYYAKEGFTIKVGPGTYKLDGPTLDDITISGKNLTLESADGAEDTIIDGNGFGILISTNKGITIDGFTIDDAAAAIVIDTEDATVTNCVITDDKVAGIVIRADGIGPADCIDATVSDNVIEDCEIGIKFEVMDPSTVDLGDVDITGNTITESVNGGIVFSGGNQDIDITGNTITGNDSSGIYFADNTTNSYVCSDISISGNTISENDGCGIEIAEPDVSQAPTKLVITENDILDNEDDGVHADGWDGVSAYVMFNNIVGNDNSVVNDASDEMNARFNWWGTTDDDDFDEGGTGGDIKVEPWLMGAQESVISGSKVAVDGKTSLDAKTAAGVKVSGVQGETDEEADIISAAKYADNPEGAIDDAIAFYDVFVRLEDPFNTTDVIAKLKFYDSAITTGSTASFWTGDFWAECSDQEARDGIIYVSVSDDTLPALDELEETIFAVVAGEAVVGVETLVLLAPEVGADDVSLTPTFAWGAVAGATGYDFQMADNANFVMPMVSLTGDAGRLIVTAYAYIGELPYSIAYYWRVRAVSADGESDWVSGVFITMSEPEEPTPPVVVEPTPPAPPAPIITIEQPDIIVPLPDVSPITPAWIYVIIGVGAVLVIALLVLIVRTRRVA